MNFIQSIFSRITLASLGDHYFKVMGGFNAEHQNVRTLSAQRDGIIVPDLPTIDTSTEQDVAGAVITIGLLPVSLDA